MIGSEINKGDGWKVKGLVKARGRVDIIGLWKSFLSVYSPFLSAFCHVFPRQQIQIAQERGKRERVHVAHFQSLKTDFLGGGGAWWEWCGGSCWGGKADAWCGSLQIEERPFPLPLPSLFFSLSILPTVCLMQRRRNRIHFIMPGLTQKNLQRRALCRFASLCQNAAMRHSSIDKLPPPASFFTSVATSLSNAYALTQSPHAPLSDNKNNRWASEMRDGKTEGEGNWVEE